MPALLRVALVLAFATAACGLSAVTATPPTPGVPGPAGIARVCVGVGEPDCARVAQAAVGMFSGRQPLWVEVKHAGCAGEAPCDPRIAPGAAARGTVHFADAGEPVPIRFVNEVPALEPTVESDVFALARAASGEAAKGVPFPFSLGHCGLGSPIDFDGSLWVPVGFVPEHPDVINAAGGSMTIETPTQARLRTEGGVLVNLMRFGPALHVRLCD